MKIIDIQRAKSIMNMRYIRSCLIFAALLTAAPALAQTSLPKELLDAIYGFTGTAGAKPHITISPNPIQTKELVVARLSNIPETAAVTWFINGTKREDLSGPGATVAAFVGPDEPGSMRIGVEIKSGGTATSSIENLFPVELSDLSRAYQDLAAQADELILKRDEALTAIDFALDSTPEAPRPGERVLLSLRAFQFNAENAEITWFANGKRIAGGKGVTEALMSAGSSGAPIEILATVITSDGRRAEKTRFLSASDISFYWWTNTYIPAWYKGKALPTPGATILIQARPNLPTSVSESLTYTWRVNGETVREASGKNKSIFAYTIPVGRRPDQITVAVNNTQQTIIQEAAFLVPVNDQRISLYEVKPLEGLDASRAVTTLRKISGGAFDLVAEPFFVPRALAGSLTYRWNLDGSEVPAKNIREPWLLTVTSSKESAGLHRIQLTAENLPRKIELFKDLAVELE